MQHIEKMKVVCFGGGTGLSSLLSGLKNNGVMDVTAIVSIFDSGGSSGELKARLGFNPSGDILKCLSALSSYTDETRRLFTKRLKPRNGSVERHTAAHAVLFGLEKFYGSYESALEALSEIYDVQGAVVPVSLTQSSLCAVYTDGTTACSEVEVDQLVRQGKEVERVYLDPEVPAYPGAVNAIRNANLLCIGPGSLYTSLLPNFLPRGIREAFKESQARVVFICNLLTEGKGMDGYTISRTVREVERAIGRPIHKVVCNTSTPDHETLARYKDEHKFPLLLVPEDGWLNDRLVTCDFWRNSAKARHDPTVLAPVISRVATDVSRAVLL